MWTVCVALVEQVTTTVFLSRDRKMKDGRMKVNKPRLGFREQTVCERRAHTRLGAHGHIHINSSLVWRAQKETHE